MSQKHKSKDTNGVTAAEVPAVDDVSPPGSAASAEAGAATGIETPETGAASVADLQARIQSLEEALVVAKTKAEENWSRHLQSQAEMQNVRKRAERDVQEAHRFALDKFVKELLPVKDSLEMGLSAAQETIDVAKLKEGTDLTLKMLTSAVEKFGVQEVDPVGQKFDPQQHEAMAMQASDQAEPNTVLQVVQKGYTLNDRLIRPAMVVVAQAAAKD